MAYALESSTWHKAIAFDRFSPAVTLSSNEKLVLISGGTTFHNGALKHVVDIDILDIRDDDAYILKKSKMRSPIPDRDSEGKREPHSIARSGGINGEMLVVGWIRAEFESAVLRHLDLPPKYIIQMIAKWHSEESIHFIGTRGGDHVAIKLKHLLL